MEDMLNIVYTYKLKDGTSKMFDIRLEKDTLRYAPGKPGNRPLWALLNFNKCRICPLSESEHAYCPVAENLAGIVEEFKNLLSHETATVTVTTAERTYGKETAIQQGLAPLLGIVMTTTGCPVMEQLKPMVRFHLPFASIEETIFRMVSMHLVAQYYRHQDGRSAAWNLDGLMRIYSDVSKVNHDFANRMRAAASKDANVNALVSLDCFATMMPLAAGEIMLRFKPYFAALLND
jgi:hypothetical protein